MPAPTLERTQDYRVGRFRAMASPCEVLIDSQDDADAAAALERAADEAARIEAKFSRYLDDSVIGRINRAGGVPVEVDEETAGLLDYAAACWEASGGKFDITSGALRRVWTFDGGDRVPPAEAVQAMLQHVGWHRVTWRDRVLTLPAGMEIDLGGIGKEYAVDRAAALIAARTSAPVLVNFGGDLFATGPRRDGRPWQVGVDDPERLDGSLADGVKLVRGGLATSGNARRFVRWKGRRLTHILDPRTGWPIEGAPSSVTVLAPSCTEAGTFATLACLEGPGAREFLERQGLQFRVIESGFEASPVQRGAAPGSAG